MRVDRIGGVARVAWLCVGMSWRALACAHSGEMASVDADFQGQQASTVVRRAARWAVGANDAQHKPFAIVDKRDARLYVFAASGRLVASTPALLGLAAGDDSVPGIGERVQTGIAPHERTTPAGRFESEPGHNDKGEAVVWVDYTAAIAIHRLRPADALERRPQRLTSKTPDDNRISLGCIIVSVAFYDTVIAPILGHQRGVVYVLPEIRSWESVFGPALNADL